MSDIAQAVAGLSQALAKLTADDRDLVLPALQILSAQLACNKIPLTSFGRFVDLYNKLGEHDSGERREIICERLGFEKSTYYRRLAEAQEAGLLEFPK